MKAPSEEIYGKSMQGKVYLVGYNAVADNRGSIFIRLAVVASAKFRETLRKFELSSSRSSKAIDLGANRKHATF